MRSNCDITLFHLRDDKESFDVVYFPKVYAYFKKKTSKSGIKQKGFYLADSIVVRIPYKKELDVALGDYICLGRSKNKSPDRADDFKITEICDNRNSTTPHYRLSCGG